MKRALLLSMLFFLLLPSVSFAYSFSGHHWHAEKASLVYGNTLPSWMKVPTFYGQQVTWDDGSPSSFYFYNDSSSGNGVWYGSIDGKYGVLAQTWFDYVVAHKGYHIVDCDFKYDSGESWHTDVNSTPPSTKVDAWSVAAHEFGHWLSLGHSSSSPDGKKPTMYPALAYGEYFPRDLAQDDKNGIWYIYEVWH
ncbi:MAG: hypothetical protein PWQ91_915 [Eubacteriales bacterium]|nr:hypothetical protein [Eubacteriales bacterium]MDN5363854.1 hypothetical protein [Eubacteriales bacterium]